MDKQLVKLICISGLCMLALIPAAGLRASAEEPLFVHDEEKETYDFYSFGVGGAAEDEARAVIEKKNKELQEIQLQVREQQKKLQETQQQTQTLSTEVKKIDTTIKTLDLGIQSSEVLIEKLELEEQVLSSDIMTTEQDIASKEAAVGELLRRMQEAENENLLFVFLKNQTLSDGLVQMQALTDLNQGLLIRIQELAQSKNQLKSVLDRTLDTKEAKEMEHQNLRSKKTIADELKKEKSTFLSQTKQKESEYQKELKELEAKQLEIALEIEKMEAQLRSQIDEGGLPKSVPGILQIPVQGIITQEHGATKFAQRAYKGKWHNGLDFGAPIGTPVVAAEDGVVIGATDQDRYCYKGAYGKYVAIKHNNGLTTLSAHLSLISVNEAEQVKRGAVIGYVGKTGYATGPHLHFGVYDSSTFKISGSASCGPKMPVGGDLNPRQYLSL